jgi:hypothetical protein
MRFAKRIAAVAAAACVSVGVPRGAAADEWNKETRFTFSRDVEIPGMVLQAGTYVFKLADSLSARHVVQVFDQNRRIVAMVMTIPTERLTAKGGPQVRFDEPPTGAPFPIKAWFYPGELGGEEFLYRGYSN